MHPFKLISVKDSFLGIPESDHTALMAHNTIVVIKDQHAGDLVCPHVALVHYLVPNVVKHVKVTVIIRQDEVIFCHTRCRDPLIIDLR